MLQQFLGRSAIDEGELSGLSGRTNEPRYTLRIQILYLRLRARSRVEGTGADQLLLLQISDQRRIQSCDKFGGGVEPLSDQARLRPSNEGTHLRVAGLVVRALDVDEPVLSFGSGEVKLPLGRREPLGVLDAVVVSEQPDIEVAASNFVQIQVIYAAVGGRDVFEKEDLDESPHQCVASQVVTEGRPLVDKLLLHAADEDANGGHAPVSAEFNRNCPRMSRRVRIFLIAASSILMSLITFCISS